MNPPGYFSGSGGGADNRPSPRKEVQLQGPRPTALRVNDNSFKIKKPPVAPSLHKLPFSGPPPVFEERKPVVIYTVSPRIIHTTASEYKRIVQRLTGNNPEGASAASSPSSAVGDPSPAARMASIEHTSPRKEREPAANGGDDVSYATDDFLADVNAELGYAAHPGILSPAPSTLPPISPGFFPPDPEYVFSPTGFFPPAPGFSSPAPGFFSPGGDPFMMGLSNMYLPSPSAPPMVSPPPFSYSYDLFGPSFDF